MTAAMNRAKAGGEFGANGEWYEGGKFLNTIPENRKLEGSRRRKARKVEVAPFVYEVAPEGMRSIYANFAGIYGKTVNGRLEVLCSEQTLAYFGTTREAVQELADRYNAGERWM